MINLIVLFCKFIHFCAKGQYFNTNMRKARQNTQCTALFKIILILDIKKLIANNETRTLDLKKTTGTLYSRRQILGDGNRLCVFEFRW